MNIVIINGPNLNLLGKRKVGLYGSVPFEEYIEQIRGTFPGVSIACFQTNHEGTIIDILHETGFIADGIILNAGGYTHTSIAIRDAIEAITTPVIEVHITDITQREDFRRASMLTAVCKESIIGHGLDGYREALEMFVR